MNALDNSGSEALENRKFSDLTNSYIPEITLHLNGMRSGWLNLWTDKNELGRPTYQISGFSPAYVLSWVLFKFTDSPWRFLTYLSLLSCYLSGVFILLYCRELGLAPVSGLISGGCLAFSPLILYWLTFPMFPSVWCWSAGALWGVTRLAKRVDYIGWLGLSFSCYSLLMTAYPQSVVYNAYILSGYGCYLSFGIGRKSKRDLIYFFIGSLTAVILALVMVAPAYIDLLGIAAESARVAADPSFYSHVLPKITSLVELLRFIAISAVPEIFGNPISDNYPFPYNGISVTPIVIFFSILALLKAFRRTWGWWLSISIVLLFAFWHPFFIFGVKYLGFHLSRSTPLGSITLPLTVIIAYGVDVLLKNDGRKGFRWVKAIAVSGVIVTLLCGISFGLAQEVRVHWQLVTVLCFIVILLAAQIRKVNQVLLIGAYIGMVAVTSYMLMLQQDLGAIANTSNLVEKVRSGLPSGSRYAVASPGVRFLPPNLNATLDLPSFHSYNSLSSKRYHKLIKMLGGDVVTFGRWNESILPNYSSPMFWMANIGLMIAPDKISDMSLDYLDKGDGFFLYKVMSRMGESLQVYLPNILNISDTNVTIDDPRLIPRATPSKLLGEGDLLEFEVEEGEPSVFILSQKYHRDWRGKVLTSHGWEAAQMLEINGVFQGVALPSETQRIRLEFLPYVRYMWVGHIFWLALSIILIFRYWLSKKEQKLIRECS